MESSPRQQAFLDLASALLRLDRSVQQVIERALAGELDLSMRAMFVLIAIDRGARQPGAVASRLILPAPTVTRTLTLLVGQGLVTREPGVVDRRRVELGLTERGGLVVAQARAVLSRALAEAWPDVPTERAADLGTGLEELVEARQVRRG